jgi:hypothetical protein
MQDLGVFGSERRLVVGEGHVKGLAAVMIVRRRYGARVAGCNLCTPRFQSANRERIAFWNHSRISRETDRIEWYARTLSSSVRCRDSVAFIPRTLPL